VLAREDYDKAKPCPEAYLLALHRLGMKAEGCVAVEDSERGLAPAHTAGLRCIAIPNDLTRNSNFTEPLEYWQKQRAVLDVLTEL
jgi:beta-phosphoglucomutase-like phosphatase (HAD superfamily)